MKCYEQIIARNHPVACILEDDACLLASFASILNSEKLRQKQWEILLLAHQSGSLTKFLQLHYRYHAIPIGRRSDIYDRYLLGSMPSNFSAPIGGGHYLAKPKGNSHSTMGYLIKLSATQKFRDIALANQKTAYIDTLIGSKGAFGVSLRLITPPCITMSLAYCQYSIIDPRPKIDDTSELPDAAWLKFFMRNKWSAVLMRLMKFQKPKLMLYFLAALVMVEVKRMLKYLLPQRRYEKGVVVARQQWRAFLLTSL